LKIVGDYPDATLGTSQKLGVPQRWTKVSGTFTGVHKNTAAATVGYSVENCAGVIVGAGTDFSMLATNTAPLANGAALRLNHTSGTATVTVHCKIRYTTDRYCVDHAPQVAVSTNETGAVYLRNPLNQSSQIGSAYEYVEFLVEVGTVTGTPALALSVESSYINPATNAETAIAVPCDIETLAAHGGSVSNCNTAPAAAVVGGVAMSTTGVTGIATTGGVLRIRVAKPLGNLRLKLSGGTVGNTAVLNVWTLAWKSVS
jgi:hypothetical protein